MLGHYLCMTQKIYNRIFMAALCFLPILGVAAPRALSFFPALIAVTGYVSYRLMAGRWPEVKTPLWLWLAGIIALMGLGYFWALDPEAVISRTLKTAPILLGGVLLVGFARAQDEVFKAGFRRYFPWAVLIAGALCLIELYTAAPLYQAMRGTFDQGLDNLSGLNRGVVFLSLCGVTGLSLLQKNNPLTYVLIAVFTAIFYKTESQSAQLSFLVGLSFYFLFPLHKKFAWTGLAALLSATILSAPWLAQFLFGKLAGSAENIGWLQRSYAAQRLEIWDFISRRALERPWLGHGVEATRTITDFDTARIYYPMSEVLHPHNFALQVWIESGLLGAVFLCAFLLYLLRVYYQSGPSVARVSLPVLMACLSAAATGYGLWQGWWLGCFTALTALGILIGDQQSHRRDK